MWGAGQFARERVARSCTLAAALTTSLLLAWSSLPSAPSASAASCPPGVARCKFGYVTMSDGAQLRWKVLLPPHGEHFPVALIYDFYCEGSDPTRCSDPDLTLALLKAGYAVVGVNERGTGCSSGVFEIGSQQMQADGAVMVEWAARQAWSTGRVGMYGLSGPADDAYAVGAQRPAGLAALAVYQAIGDLYRDVGYPGGIYNQVFSALFGGYIQPNRSYKNSAQWSADQDDDPQCQLNMAARAIGSVSANVLVTGPQHPYDDAVVQERFLGYDGRRAAAIDVPVLGCQTWQDDQVGSRMTETWRRLDPRWLWVVVGNGFHLQCEQQAGLLVRFFDRFVKGERNRFEAVTPHVQIDHEVMADASLETKPRWSTTSAAWPPATDTTSLHLHSGGLLNEEPPAAREAQDSYAYPRPGASTEEGAVVNSTVGRRDGAAWSLPVDHAGARAFTTPPLAHDAELLGPASANLWLSSTASDTDLQLTVTEVRPDGQEMYVMRGWLRASKRALDVQGSRATRPLQTFQESDVRPLVPGQPTLLRVEVLPFDHVFRAGSRLRLIVDAPTGVTGGWSLQFNPTPATNTILHDSIHDSQLVIGLVRDGRARLPYPPCGPIANQPCRDNQFALPGGRLDLHSERLSRSHACSGQRALKFSLHAPSGRRVVGVKVYVNGKLVRSRRGRRLRSVRFSAGRARALKVRVVATLDDGRRMNTLRRYRACAGGSR
jgi:uncharacterized protein